MKTFFELKQQYLNEHHIEYKAFTRLLLMLSVGFITLLAAALEKDKLNEFISIDVAILLHLLSLSSGLFVQHRIMMKPIYHLNQAETVQTNFQENGDGSQIEMRRLPSVCERIAYKMQVGSFLFGFVCFSWFLVYQ